MEGDDAAAEERAWLLFRLARMRRYANPQKAVAYLTEAQRVLVMINDAAADAFFICHRGLLRCIAADIPAGMAEMRAGVAELAALPEADRMRLRAQAQRVGTSDPDEFEGTFALWLANTGQYAEARERGEQFIAHRPVRAEAHSQDGSGLGDAFNSLGHTYAALGLPPQARRAFAQAREVHGAVGHFAHVGSVAGLDLWWVVVPYCTDQVEERLRLAEEATTAYTRTMGIGIPDVVRRQPYALLRWIEGEWDEARAMMAATWEDRIQLRGGIRLEQPVWGALEAAQGNHTAAWKAVHAVLPDGADTAPGIEYVLIAMPAQRLAAHLALAAGDSALARDWLLAHDHWLEWSGAVLGQSEGQAMWAHYHRQIGDAAQSLEHAERALAHASEPRQPLALIAAHRLLGELDTDTRRFADAEEHLNASIALADACTAPYERALTLLAVAELRAATGDADAARALLDEVRAICTPLGAAPALARADILTQRLGTPPSLSYPAGLSAREVEVLALVAQGLTNPQVADRLFLSPRTVNQHLRSIYNKLGVSSRAAATRFAIEHRLS
jgi:DNA-binding CsgD family transcriptional regulator